MSSEVVGAIALLLLAVAHSVLGEVRVVGPLLAADWSVGLPRGIADRIVRFAWHLPSLAWLALALILLGGPISVAIAIAAGVPGLVLFLTVRAHLAWPLFLLAAIAALWSEGRFGNSITQGAAVATSIGFGLGALLHIYWAAGGRWLLDKAVPSVGAGGRQPFVPGRLLTAAVAVVLGGFALLLAAVSAGEGSALMRILVAAGATVLVARAIGDTRYAGFTKTVRGTAFAVADDRVLTPLVVFFAFGSVAALLVA